MARWVDIKEVTVSLAALHNRLFPHISVLLVQENKVSQHFMESLIKKRVRFKNSQKRNVKKTEIKGNTQRFVYQLGCFQDNKLAQGAKQKSRKPNNILC